MKTQEEGAKTIEIYKSAKPYLGLYDLSNEKMVSDYKSANYGDFLTRLFLRSGLETIRVVDSFSDSRGWESGWEAKSKNIAVEWEATMNKVLQWIHDEIHDEKTEVLGILTPSCDLLHLLTDSNLNLLTTIALIPFYLHKNRDNAELFSYYEENKKTAESYKKATTDELFRIIKMTISSNNKFRDVLSKHQINVFNLYIESYSAVALQERMEYADFSEQVELLEKEARLDLYDKSSSLWDIKTITYEDENELNDDFPLDGTVGKKEEKKELFQRLGQLQTLLDVNFLANSGMIDSKFATQSTAILDYYVSLFVPLDDLKELRTKIKKRGMKGH